ncbi:MAG: hypothetical protein R3D57_00295 [Hyphomicrobiaceae bacterium]
MSDRDDVLPLPGDYVALVRGLLDSGYEIRGFANVEPDKPHLILRHDVDISIEHARRLAEIEHQELGVSASYFILLRTEFYNPFSKENTQHLKAMIAMGHEIGLHIDFSLYGDSTFHHHVIRESRILTDILDVPIYLVSFHRPSTLMKGKDYQSISLPGFVSAYDKRVFSDIGFVSDSRGGWYHGHPLEHPAVKARRALQLLTHPIWWTSDGADENARDLLKHYARANARQMLHSFHRNFRILRDSDLGDDAPKP